MKVCALYGFERRQNAARVAFEWLGAGKGKQLGLGFAVHLAWIRNRPLLALKARSKPLFYKRLAHAIGRGNADPQDLGNTFVTERLTFWGLVTALLYLIPGEGNGVEALECDEHLGEVGVLGGGLAVAGFEDDAGGVAELDGGAVKVVGNDVGVGDTDFATGAFDEGARGGGGSEAHVYSPRTGWMGCADIAHGTGPWMMPTTTLGPAVGIRERCGIEHPRERDVKHTQAFKQRGGLFFQCCRGRR